MAIKDHLAEERFFGAKASGIRHLDVVKRAPALGNELVIVDVDGDYYQMLVDDRGKDVLPSLATELGEALAEGSPVGFGQWSGHFPSGLTGRALSGEQSNTSLAFDETVMVKYFRKLEPGLNPDVELLSQITDCPHVAPVLGYATEELDGQPYTLLMAQAFVRDGRDGWKLALKAASQDEPFDSEARMLGKATASVHTALADAFGVEDVSTDTIVDGLLTRLDYLTAQAPVIGTYADAARAVYESLRGTTTQIQRIHGDLHLGQVLRTPERYILIDFEGEPARPLSERRRPDSPLRDVAGILRSIDYAAHFDGTHDDWARDASAAFLDGYAQGFGHVSDTALLDAYVLDKALYEVAYEANNRPDWVEIPLRAVRSIVDGAA